MKEYRIIEYANGEWGARVKIAPREPWTTVSEMIKINAVGPLGSARVVEGEMRRTDREQAERYVRNLIQKDKAALMRKTVVNEYDFPNDF